MSSKFTQMSHLASTAVAQIQDTQRRLFYNILGNEYQVPIGMHMVFCVSRLQLAR